MSAVLNSESKLVDDESLTDRVVLVVWRAREDFVVFFEYLELINQERFAAQEMLYVDYL